jgi:vancomycin permeability regulator SanA
MNKNIVRGLAVACAALFIIASWGRASLANALSAEDEQLYNSIIRKTSGIKPAQYPIKRRFERGTQLQFLDASGVPSRGFKTAVIILGSKPLDKTTPTIDLVYRVFTAMDLLQSHPEAIIVMTGGRTLKDISEARMMGVIAWSRGMDTQKIILEEDSRTTEENARFCARIFDRIPLEHVFLVSRKNHLKRALRNFEQYDVFKHCEAVDCGIQMGQLIQQMEEYLKGHNDPVVAERLRRLREYEKR